MSDRLLRAGLIRLAHAHPEFRADILPLVTATYEQDVAQDADPNSKDQSKADYWNGLAPQKPAIDEPALPPKTAAGAIGPSLAKMKNDTNLSFSDGANTVFAHVWFDTGVAQYDRGGVAPDSGEWDVMVSTSPDRLNLNPRGKELGRQTFRYAEARSRPIVLDAAEKYIVTMLARHRSKTAKLMSRQETLLQKYMETAARSGGRAATGWDELPDSVRKALRAVKDQETLWMDVDRWFMDNAPPGGLRWASGEGQSADDYWNGLEPKKPAIDEPALPPKQAASKTAFEIKIEYKVRGGPWQTKQFRNGREFEAWSDKMQKVPGFEINPDSVDGHSEEYLRSLLAKNQSKAAAWENLPPGWTQESVQSFWDSLTGDVKHKVTKCMKEMEGKVDNTGAFCGSLGAAVGYRAASSGKNASLFRKAAIRVAHENPEHRAAILPSLSKKA